MYIKPNDQGFTFAYVMRPFNLREFLGKEHEWYFEWKKNKNDQNTMLYDFCSNNVIPCRLLIALSNCMQSQQRHLHRQFGYHEPKGQRTDETIIKIMLIDNKNL